MQQIFAGMSRKRAKMAKANGSGDGLIIIKKYANRRLYDTSSSSYVTLDHLSALVRKGDEFEVHDARTGDDITRAVLTQIIFERETKGEGALPLGFLRKLIGFYGGGAQPALPAWLDMSMNSFAENQEKWRASVGTASPMSLFKKQAQRNMVMFEKAMTMFTPGAGFSGTDTSAELDMPDATEDMLSAMQAQMAEMQEQLSAMAKKK
jgi:polyhydroxyalkanoate synthesis repressor PhaR